MKPLNGLYKQTTTIPWCVAGHFFTVKSLSKNILNSNKWFLFNHRCLIWPQRMHYSKVNEIALDLQPDFWKFCCREDVLQCSLVLSLTSDHHRLSEVCYSKLIYGACVSNKLVCNKLHYISSVTLILRTLYFLKFSLPLRNSLCIPDSSAIVMEVLV